FSPLRTGQTDRGRAPARSKRVRVPFVARRYPVRRQAAASGARCNPSAPVAIAATLTAVWVFHSGFVPAPECRVRREGSIEQIVLPSCQRPEVQEPGKRIFNFPFSIL